MTVLEACSVTIKSFKLFLLLFMFLCFILFQHLQKQFAKIRFLIFKEGGPSCTWGSFNGQFHKHF